jgi:subtilisin family serine protease
MKKNNLVSGLLIIVLGLSSNLTFASNKISMSASSKSDRYIVVYKDHPTSMSRGVVGIQSKLNKAYSLSSGTGVEIKKVFNSVLNGFVIKGSYADIEKISKNPDVLYVEQDKRVYTTALTTQANAPWGLDRIDQRGRGLNGKYTYDRDGRGVNVYVIDTGVRDTHDQFNGRAFDGRDVLRNVANINGDCNGHGTHVAGTIAGVTSGVAKETNIIAVRALDCNGAGFMSDLISAIDWVRTNGTTPAVINASIGGEGTRSVDDAVRNVIKAGFVFVTSAGNDAEDACSQSPARVKQAITVGSTDSNDARSSFSNYGQCVDVWAPGRNIVSASNSNNTSLTSKSGTSMAAPHVAGIAALFLQGSTNVSANTVLNYVMGKTTYGKVTDLRTNDTPNLLAYSLGTSNTYTALHRYNHAENGDHFYTPNWSELQSAPDSGWVYEGILGYIERKNIGGSSLYRYYHSGSKDHFYTTNFNELGNGHSGWVKEGVTGFLPKKSSTTSNVYRYYNSKIGDHMYTTNYNELGGGKDNWSYEGVAGQAYKGARD